MSKKRKHSPQFKLKVALSALKSGNTTQVAREFGITPGLAHRWTQQLIESGEQVFLSTPDKEVAQLKRHISKLEQLLGKKEVEIGLIKNFADFYQSLDTP